MPAGGISRHVRPAQIIRQKLNTVEQAEAFFEKHHDPWTLRPMGRTFSATTTLLQLGDLRVWCAGSGPAHEMIPIARPPRCLVNFLTAGRMEARFGNEMAMLSEGQGWIRDSGRLEFVRKHPGLRMTSFDLPRALLEDHLEKARSREASPPYQYVHTIDAREGTGRILANLVSVIVNGLDTGQTLSSFSYPALSFSTLVLDLLVHGIILAQPSQIRTIDSRTLRRAIDFIEGNLQRPLAIVDIAEAAGVGPRALQFAFRREFGYSPLKYARRRRLAAVHHDLVTNTRSLGIAEIAARWGFIHLGLFAQQYREVYGERPSDTKCVL
ncbi:helix-turn-helix transcriptional regulator [Xanthobacteraceae bacterium Astr-EGSB]|uniref:AraC family transcriptional regulator n=1 Tax=Astrobacterium formosum TaxID=3069710 RepID=UPI0027AF34AE|nr:helix-turn-helix transcriptional regulator [Xanthobacteraceae bacterium Astr-EGSB]